MINYSSKFNYLSIKLITCQNKLIADQKMIDYMTVPLNYSYCWEFLVKILLAYYLSYTLDYNNFIQLSPTVMKSCHIKCDHPACVSADGGHFEHMM